MTYIRLITNDRQLLLNSDDAISAGERETVLLTVSADATWHDYALCAAFWRDGEREKVQDVPLDEGGSCVVPSVMLIEPCELCIGIWGEDILERRKTSTVVRYPIRPGAPTEGDVLLANVADGTATPDAVLRGASFYAGSDEAQTGTIETFTLGEMEEDLPKEDLPEEDGGESGGTVIPMPAATFDLTALGLPALTPDGEPATIETDTAAMASALESGAARFTLTANIGTEITLSALLNPISDGAGTYLCSAMLDADTPMLLTVTVTDGTVIARLTTLNSHIDSYMEEALGGDY